MKAGPELDALIAEKVFGIEKNSSSAPYLTVYGGEDPHLGPTYVPFVKRYSTEICAAWKVVERLSSESGLHFALEKSDTWLARFSIDSISPGDTAPHAICLAALKTVNQP